MATGNTKFTTQHGLQVVGNTEIEQDLKVLGSANIVGDITVGGSMVFSANIVGNFIPDVSGRSLGNTANRWEVYANSLNIANTTVFAGDATPTTNSISLGSTTARWFVYASDVNVANVVSVSNNVIISNNISVANVAFIGPALAIQSNSATYNAVIPAQTVIDSYARDSFRTAKYMIQVKNATTGYQASELLLTHDGTTVFITEYGVVNSVATFCTFDADISGGLVRLLATPTTNATFRVSRLMFS